MPSHLNWLLPTLTLTHSPSDYPSKRLAHLYPNSTNKLAFGGKVIFSEEGIKFLSGHLKEFKAQYGGRDASTRLGGRRLKPHTIHKSRRQACCIQAQVLREFYNANLQLHLPYCCGDQKRGKRHESEPHCCHPTNVSYERHNLRASTA